MRRERSVMPLLAAVLLLLRMVLFLTVLLPEPAPRTQYSSGDTGKFPSSPLEPIPEEIPGDDLPAGHALFYDSIPVDSFRVSGLSPGSVTDLDYVDWWYSEWDDCRYLFLPATADRKKLKLEFSTRSGDLTLNGTAPVSGRETDILAAADTFRIRCGGKDCGLLHVMQSTLPVVYLSAECTGTVTVKNGDDKETVTKSGFDLLDSSKKSTASGRALMLCADGREVYQGAVEEIAAHGNSSWDYSKKKPYDIKLPEKADLFGMGKAKKWVFLSNYLDHSMLRNTTAYRMAEQLGIDFVPDTVYADVYAEGVYKGTYQISERVQVGKDRVNITDLEKATEQCNDAPLQDYPHTLSDGADSYYRPEAYRYYEIPDDPEDITGGYLIQLQLCNRYDAKVKSGFVTLRGQVVQITAPKYASAAQFAYIRQFVQDLEDALYSDTGYNDKGQHFTDYIDIESFAKGYLLQECTQNADNTYTSFYLWKDSDRTGDGKLHYGPPWDFDLAFCNFAKAVTPADGIQRVATNTEILYAAYFPISGYRDTKHNPLYADYVEGWGWLSKLWQRAEFRTYAETLYFSCMDSLLCALTAPAESGCLLEQLAAPLRSSAEMNLLRWHAYGGKPYKPIGPVNGQNYTECVEYLENFVNKRRAALRRLYGENLTADLCEGLAEIRSRMDVTLYDDAAQEVLDTLLNKAQRQIRRAESPEAAAAAVLEALEAFSLTPKTVES